MKKTEQPDYKAELEDLFTRGFRDYPAADPKLVAESQPYQLGLGAAARLEQLDAERSYILAKAKELSGGAVLRVGFVQ